MSNEVKIRCVESTIKHLEKMAEECEKQSSEWYEVRMNDLGNFYEGKSKAYRLAIKFLKMDLED